MQNMATAATLFVAGRAVMRENIRRRNPNASATAIERLLAAWMRRDDDPVPGDTVGNVRFKARIP